MRLEAGAQLGRYTIEALLGEGGMGEVYRAFDTLLRRRVALKILRVPPNVEAADPSSVVAKILREARVVAALHHPNAVAIFDIGEHGGVHFLAMELVSGPSLRAFVGRSDVPIEQRVRWLADIGRALDAAHKARVVHLDIKPENVLVSEDATVKVLDFGVARRVVEGHDLQTSATTVTGLRNSLAGTPRYMAPEQVQQGELDGRTDQFSWGVLAYELLSGKMPWREGQSLFDMFSTIVHEAPPSLRGLNAEVPEALEKVILRALSKLPAERFPTMGALLAALEQAFPQIGPAPSWSQPDLLPLASPASVTKPAARGVDASAFGDTTPDISKPSPSDRLGATALAAKAPPPRERWSEAWRWKVAGALLFGALAATLGGRAWLAPRAVVFAPDAHAPAPTAQVLAPPAPTSLLDLPPPMGCNPASLTEFRIGLQAQRDGDWNEAHESFERAVKADPDCAAAHLRLTLAAYYQGSPSRMREVYQRAVQLRAALSERDRQLLDALDPLVRRDPADPKAFATRLRALSEQFPGDAELMCLSGEYAIDLDFRLARGRAAVALDPHYSDAFQLIASTFLWQRQMDAAIAVLDQCLDAAPNSVDCIHERIELTRIDGRCEEMEANARLWIARAPKSTEAYEVLARALAARGSSTGAIEEALRQRWSRLTELERTQKQPLEHALLDAFTGRFDRAAEGAREAARLVEADPSYESHAGPTLLLVNLMLETDQADKAGSLAEDFLARRNAWSSSLRSGSVAVKTFHLEPLLLDAERDARKISEREWQAARTGWMESTRPTRRLNEQELWALGVAMPVRTPAEAALALQSKPATLRVSDLDAHVLTAASFTGRALLLAGETDEAIELLRHAVMHCDALEIPFEDTRANLWLGQALEKKGDPRGACAAYQVVLRRWGDATPPSSTAALAKRRLRALGCGR